MVVSCLLNGFVWRCLRREQQKRNDQVCDDRSYVWSCPRCDSRLCMNEKKENWHLV